MQEDSGFTTKVILFAAGVVTASIAAITKIFLDRRKTVAEAQSITHGMHQADAKEYREMFRQAEAEIRKSRRHWMNAEFFIRGMLFKMEKYGCPGWEEDNAAWEKMLKEMEK